MIKPDARAPLIISGIAQTRPKILKAPIIPYPTTSITKDSGRFKKSDGPLQRRAGTKKKQLVIVTALFSIQEGIHWADKATGTWQIGITININPICWVLR